MPPHSWGMCGSQMPASWALARMPNRALMYSARSSMWSGSVSSASVGLMTSSTKVRTRMRRSSSSGERVKSMAIAATYPRSAVLS